MVRTVTSPVRVAVGRPGLVEFSLEKISALAPVFPLWTKLETQTNTSFFLSWRWIGTWLQHLPREVEPLLLRANRGENTVAAAILVPRRERRRAMLNVRQLHFNATGDPALDCITIEHNGFVGANDKGLWAAFLHWFASGAAQADELFVPGISSGVLDGLADAAGLLHDAQDRPGFVRHLAARPLQEELSPNTRQHLRRSLRDCEKLGPLQIESAISVEQALDWFEELKVLHIQSWNRKRKRHAFSHPFFETYHRDLITAYSMEGAASIHRVSAGGVILGYLYNLCAAGRTYAYQSGFDMRHARLRPGYVAHALAMEQCAAAGMECYDFLAGDNQLKRSLGESRYTLVWHRFARPTPSLRAENLARSVIKAMRR